jgi:hypothetical protein
MERSLSSIGLHSFQGIRDLPQKPKCVNHVSGTFCKLSDDNHISPSALQLGLKVFTFASLSDFPCLAAGMFSRLPVGLRRWPFEVNTSSC